jgi:foldase protein PrsA
MGTATRVSGGWASLGAAAAASAALFLTATAGAQQAKQGAAGAPVRPTPSEQPQVAKAGAGAHPAPAPEDLGGPLGRFVRVPVNPNDPVAKVNGEPITRAQLAEECLARHGKEVLENMINRRLVDQAIRAKKLQITPREIDAEIDREAAMIGKTDRKTWLMALSKNRGISPQQYAHDIIYPVLAMRKLAAPRVQVTDQDMSDAFEAYFGARLRYRLIMVGQQRHALEMWEELKKNPAGFAKIASDDPRSIDQATRAAGGLAPEPLTRHAHPRTVSDSAFAQLIDGDPKDTDPNHKPKDGDITGPIQVTESTWVILKREGLIPGRPYDPNSLELKQEIRDSILEAKVQQEMSTILDELFLAASIENMLIGVDKKANEHVELSSQADAKLSRTSNQQAPSPRTAPRPDGKEALPDEATSLPKSATLPPGVSPSDVPSSVDPPTKAASKAPR